MQAESPDTRPFALATPPVRTRWSEPAVWLCALLAYSITVVLAERSVAIRLSLFAWLSGASIAAFGCVQAARAAAGRWRRAWLLFAGACAALVAQLVWVWIDAVRRAPMDGASGPNLLLVVFGGLTAAAVYEYRGAHTVHSSSLRRMINIALISLAFAAACIAAFLEPALKQPRSGLSLLITLLQLLVFALAFVAALYVLWSHQWKSLRSSPLRVAAAVALQATCGLFYVHAAYVRVGGPPAYVGAAWMLSFGLLHWAARDQLRGVAPGAPALDAPAGRHERLVDALLPGLLVAMMVIALFAFRAQITERTILIVGAVAALFSVMLAAREVLVYYEETRLEHELQQRGVELAQTQQSLRSKTTALHETEQWLRVAADAAKIGLWAWDLASKRVYYSPQWKRQLGYEEHEISDAFEEWRSRVHPDDVERAQQQVNAFVANPTGDYQLEARLRHRDGSYRWILAQATMLHDEDGKPTSMVGSHVDITRQKAIELRLQESSERHRERAGELEERVSERTRELQEAYRELESFSYAVAHDLKAPLRAMNSFSTLLLESPTFDMYPTERSYAQRIRAGSTRMNELIEGLLDYSRIDRRTMQREPLALPECVNAAVAPYASEIDERNILLRITAPDARVNVDREALNLVLRNLLENAVKFTRRTPSPMIEVTGEVRDDTLLLRVKDNGIGFDPQYSEQIFAMFKRLHRDDQYPGTGIGLALAAKAAQRMRGRLWAESAPGCGACFYLELPLDDLTDLRN